MLQIFNLLAVERKEEEDKGDGVQDNGLVPNDDAVLDNMNNS